MTIEGGFIDEEGLIFEEGVYFSVFYYLHFVKEITMGMLEEQSREERDPDLEGEEDIRLSDDRVKCWNDIVE